MDYSLDLLIKGLSHVCAPYSQQKKEIYDKNSPIDEMFDFVVLDGLNYLVETKQITSDISESIRKLYGDADRFLDGMNAEQEDLLFESNAEVVDQWKKRAKEILIDIEKYQNEKPGLDL